jgi:hypothetical protein
MMILVAKAAEMAEVVLIQEPGVRWVADIRGESLRQHVVWNERSRRGRQYQVWVVVRVVE